MIDSVDLFLEIDSASAGGLEPDSSRTVVSKSECVTPCVGTKIIWLLLMEQGTSYYVAETSKQRLAEPTPVATPPQHARGSAIQAAA